MIDFQKLLEEKKKELLARRTQERGPTGRMSRTTIRRLSGDEKRKKLYLEMIARADVPNRYCNCNLNNYQPYPDNEDSYRRVLKYLGNYQELEAKGSWLIMIGDYGTGKTHLAVAMMKKICYGYAGKAVQEYQDFPLSIIRGQINIRPVLFVKTPELLEKIRTAYDRNDINEDDVLSTYKLKKFLVIDDLGSEKPSGWQQEKLYSILDYRYSNLRPTVITSNYDLNELVGRIGQRIVDRIQEAAGDYITGWKGESYRMKGEG